jgi:Tol biopolymer transport system component
MLNRTLLTIPVLLFMSIAIGVPASTAHAGACRSETVQIREQEPYASHLPDCRAYEQVSPINKNLADALGATGYVQSSPFGGAVTFFSASPFPEVVPGSSEYPTYLATSEREGWSVRGLLPPSDPGWFAKLVGVTEDLSESVVIAGEPEPSSGQGGTPDAYNYYVEDNTNGTYRLLVPGPAEVVFADASSDGSEILFEIFVGGVPSLYLWEEGKVSLVSAEAVAGPLGPVMAGNKQYVYTYHAISRDGSRIFYTSLSGSIIYMSEPRAGRTIRVSGDGPAEWLTATPGGSKVVYSEGKELYLFNIETGERKVLTGGNGANVLGALGISNSGSSVYFAATDALPSEGVEGRVPVNGVPNIYEWRKEAPTLTFIATLSEAKDLSDWRNFYESSTGKDREEKSSRVTPSGEALLFISSKELSSRYPDPNDAYQIYLYNASNRSLVCVSCNPDGVPPAANANASLTSVHSVTNPVFVSDQYLTRNLAEDGEQVFFETHEALVPSDTNGQADVYEWENGHIYLISTGTDSSPSYFGNASANGSEVFFFNRQSLVGQDRDDNYDLYDAHVNGGIAAQNLPEATSCEEGNMCHGALSSPPVFSVPYSASFIEAGNLAPQSIMKAVKSSKSKRKGKSKRRKKTTRKGTKDGGARKAKKSTGASGSGRIRS